MSRPSSPKTSGTSSRSPFESPSSPKPSGRMETGSLPLGRPSKRSHSPCPAGTPSMRPTKHTCWASSPPSLPHSILVSSNSTEPSDSGQPIKSTFASLILPGLKTSGHIPHLVWVRVSEMEARAQGEQASLPLEGESPATTGIEAPVTSKHLNGQYAHVCDRSRCRGAHRRAEYPKSKPQPGAQ